MALAIIGQAERDGGRVGDGQIRWKEKTRGRKDKEEITEKKKNVKEREMFIR